MKNVMTLFQPDLPFVLAGFVTFLFSVWLYVVEDERTPATVPVEDRIAEHQVPSTIDRVG